MLLARVEGRKTNPLNGWFTSSSTDYFYLLEPPKTLVSRGEGSSWAKPLSAMESDKFSLFLLLRCWWWAVSFCGTRWPQDLVIDSGELLAIISTFFLSQWDGCDGRCLYTQYSLSCFCLALFFLLRAVPSTHGSSQARGSNRSCSFQPTAQLQQHQIRASSATYTTATVMPDP